MELVSTRIHHGQAEVIFLRRRFLVTDLGVVHGVIGHLLRRRDVKSVVLDLSGIDLVDNSFINMLRSLALEARALRRIIRLTSAPAVLRHVLSASSHRLSWAVGLIAPDAAAQAGRALRNGEGTQ